MSKLTRLKSSDFEVWEPDAPLCQWWRHDYDAMTRGSKNFCNSISDSDLMFLSNLSVEFTDDIINKIMVRV